MAYAALVSLSGTINQMLHSYEYHVHLDLNQTSLQMIHSLQENVTLLLSFLKDIPSKFSTNLEPRIRDAAYHAEDIIENFISSQLSLKYSYKGWNITHLLNNGFLWHEKFQSQGNAEQLCRDLLDVTEKIEQILEELKEMKISYKIKGGAVLGEGDVQPKHISPAAAEGSSMALRNNDDLMVGRKDDLMSLLSRICGYSSKREVILITGMGGSGKTTMARHLYNERVVVQKFDFCSWVTVSQEYIIQDILLKILHIEETKKQTEENVESLIVMLYQYLTGRKYLIVLDDVWDGETWDALRRAFPENNNGSRVILTTRNEGVASHVDPSAHCHKLNLLSDDESWNLLENKIYGGEQCPSELEKVGREISQKCKGLPLAIVMIAGVLSTERTIHHWSSVAFDLMSELRDSGNDIFEILSLSYTHLPHHLKPCFLHVGAAFPEDFLIDASTLVRLWIAEGFLEPHRSKSPEEIAEEYLEDLIKRNLVLVISKRYHDDKIECCSIHDVLREWCVRRAEDESFFFHLKHENDNECREATVYQRRISTYRTTRDKGGSACPNGPHMRSLMFFKKDIRLMSCIRNCRLLRLLDARVVFWYTDSKLSTHYMKPPMTDILELFHLRYLCLYVREPEFKLPRSISRLVNLQTLFLDCYLSLYEPCEVHLPTEIWGMSELRYLIISSKGHFLLPDSSITKSSNWETFNLPNLQKLSKAFNLMCSKKILNMMPKVRELGLYYKVNNSMVREVVSQFENLKEMTRLERFFLRFEPDHTWFRLNYWNPTLSSKNIAFPETVKILQLGGCVFPWESMTMIGSLPNLEVLDLRDYAFNGTMWVTRDGEFCRLKVLTMRRLSLNSWIVAESSHFPSLRRLNLYYMLLLEGIPDSIGEISSLELIELKASRFAEASARKILKEQQDLGNDLLQIRIQRSWRNQ